MAVKIILNVDNIVVKKFISIKPNNTINSPTKLLVPGKLKFAKIKKKTTTNIGITLVKPP